MMTLGAPGYTTCFIQGNGYPQYPTPKSCVGILGRSPEINVMITPRIHAGRITRFIYIELSIILITRKGKSRIISQII